jgi:replicative DNA helicase
MVLNAEQTLVAELILNSNQLPEVRALIPDGTFFQNSQCAGYYEAILDAYDIHGTVDIVLASETINARGMNTTDIGDWILLVNNYGRVINHAKVVAEKYIKRIGSETIRTLHNDFTENPAPFQSLDQAISSLTHLRSQFQKEHAVSMAYIAKEVRVEIENLRKGINNAIPFGFVDIDNATGGMENGDLIVIAGLEKRGKSTLAIQTLFRNAQKKIPCLFFSTEMKRKQIMFRYAILTERLSYINAKHNKLTPLEWERLLRRIDILESYPFYVLDSALTILDIMSESERFVQERGVKLICVDYIQRVVPINKKSNENREREIASISSGLKNISMALNVPVIALSQLNEDLRARESRAIEQDMDKMITINSEDKDEIKGDMATIAIRIKQRMGLSSGFGEIKMCYDRLYGSWKSYSPEIEHDEPVQTQAPF